MSTREILYAAAGSSPSTGGWVLISTPNSGYIQGFGSIVNDGSNNFYIAGVTDRSLTITKITTAGAVTWKKQVSNSSIAYTAGVDNRLGIAYYSNYIYASGQYYDFSTYKRFVTKFDTSGVIQWQRAYTNGSTAKCQTSTTGVSTAGGYGGTGGGIFLTYTDFAGTLQSSNWVKGPNSSAEINEIAASPARTILYGAGSLFSTYFYAVNFVWNGTGGNLGRTTLGYTGSYAYFYGATTDSSGNLYSVGGLENSGTGVLLTKWDSAGSTLAWEKWIKVSASAGQIYGYSCVCDSSSNIYVVGTQVDASSGTPVNIYIAKFNSSGVVQWQETISYPGVGHQANASNATPSISIDTTGTFIYVSTQTYNGTLSKYEGVVFKLPTSAAFTTTLGPFVCTSRTYSAYTTPTKLGALASTSSAPTTVSSTPTLTIGDAAYTTTLTST